MHIHTPKGKTKGRLEKIYRLKPFSLKHQCWLNMQLNCSIKLLFSNKLLCTSWNLRHISLCQIQLYITVEWLQQPTSDQVGVKQKDILSIVIVIFIQMIVIVLYGTTVVDHHPVWFVLQIESLSPINNIINMFSLVSE